MSHSSRIRGVPDRIAGAAPGKVTVTVVRVRTEGIIAEVVEFAEDAMGVVCIAKVVREGAGGVVRSARNPLQACCIRRRVERELLFFSEWGEAVV